MTTETMSVTLDSLLRVLMPPGERSFVRLAVGPERGEPERFFMRRGNHWAACDQQGSGFEDFIVAHGARGSKFSPIAWASYSYGSPMLAAWAVWSSVQGEVSNGAKPSITIDEGDRMTSLWLLRSPIYDMAELKGLLERLRRVHGGNASLAAPRDALISIPGTKTVNIVPAKTVAVIAWDPTRTYDVGKVVPS